MNKGKVFKKVWFFFKEKIEFLEFSEIDNVCEKMIDVLKMVNY